jgi:acetyl esterase/lipase
VAADLPTPALLDADGTLNIPAFRLPFSQYASAEAKAEQAGRLMRLAELSRSPQLAPARGLTEPDLLHKPWFEAQWRRYPVEMAIDEVGGVEVQVFTPKGGVSDKNRDRVLIDLHGGGFMHGWPFGSQIESLPLCSVGQIKVISVNYRMAPEARFPAASEDVSTVYAALLDTYKPSQIGLYGTSAGGMLAAQAIAWFDKVGLPNPAAIGVVSATLGDGFGGDSAHTTPRMGGYFPVPDPPTAEINHPYFIGAKRTDPLVAPLNSAKLLGSFPPTLIATGTRAGDMSGAVHSHIQLVKAGVDARLYLWDALEHCFMFNPELPESQEFYDIAIRFFDEAMDRNV